MGEGRRSTSQEITSDGRTDEVEHSLMLPDANVLRLGQLLGLGDVFGGEVVVWGRRSTSQEIASDGIRDEIEHSLMLQDTNI